MRGDRRRPKYNVPLDQSIGRAVRDLYDERDSMPEVDGVAEYPTNPGPGQTVFDRSIGDTGEVRIYDADLDVWLPAISHGGGGSLVHELASESALGPEHTVSGLTSGHVLKAAGPTSAYFQAIVNSDLPVVDVPHGGHGRTSVTLGNLLIGAGVAALTLLAPGAAGGFVRSDGSAWIRNTIQVSDIPAHASTHNTGGSDPITALAASVITTGQLALARGGTAADLSATGGASQVVRQSSVGAAFTVSQLAFSDLSSVLAYAQLPTGGGTWANGGALSITGGVTTVAGLTSSALITASAGLTVASGQTLTLTGATVAGAPTWSSNQAITLSTASQPNVTTMSALVTVGALASGSIAAGFGNINNASNSLTTGAITATKGVFGSGTGTLSTGDVQVRRASNQGVVYFGDVAGSGDHYLFWNGPASHFTLGDGPDALTMGALTATTGAYSGAVYVNGDPGGSQALRVTGGVQITNNSYFRGKTIGGTETRLLGVDSSNNTNLGSIDHAEDIHIFSNGGTETALFTSAAFSPFANGGLTLGTSSLKWGSAWMGALTATTGTFSDTGNAILASGNVIITSDTKGFLWRDAGTTHNAFLGSVKGWLGTGSNVTDAALGASGDLYLYPGGSGSTVAKFTTTQFNMATVSGSVGALANVVNSGSTPTQWFLQAQNTADSNPIFVMMLNGSAANVVDFALGTGGTTTRRISLSTAAWYPTTASGMTLGTSGNPWGSTYTGAITGSNFFIGDVGHGSSFAGWSNSGTAGTGNYAILQHSAGDTYLNAASGKNVYMRINNSDIGDWNSSRFNLVVNFVTSGTIKTSAGQAWDLGTYNTGEINTLDTTKSITVVIGGSTHKIAIYS